MRRSATRLLIQLCVLLCMLLGGASAVATGQHGTYRCDKYGYSIDMPPGWKVRDIACTNRNTRLFVSDDSRGVIAVEIINPEGQTLAFRDLAGAVLATLGADAATATYGKQIMGGVSFDSATATVAPSGTNQKFIAYLAGTMQHGTQYLFNSYLLNDGSTHYQTQLGQLHSAFNSIRFFTGEDAIAPFSTTPRLVLLALLAAGLLVLSYYMVAKGDLAAGHLVVWFFGASLITTVVFHIGGTWELAVIDLAVKLACAANLLVFLVLKIIPRRAEVTPLL